MLTCKISKIIIIIIIKTLPLGSALRVYIYIFSLGPVSSANDTRNIYIGPDIMIRSVLYFTLLYVPYLWNTIFKVGFLIPHCIFKLCVHILFIVSRFTNKYFILYTMTYHWLLCIYYYSSIYILLVVTIYSSILNTYYLLFTHI